MSGSADGHPPLHPDELEVAPGSEHEALQGSVPSLATEQDTLAAMERAFQYRGDITITRKDGSVVECFVFDRRPGATLAESVIRVMLKDSSEKLSVPYSEIAGIAFTGRDTAAGKGWEAWLKTYWQKKAAGEQNIGIVPEPLDS